MGNQFPGEDASKKSKSLPVSSGHFLELQMLQMLATAINDSD